MSDNNKTVGEALKNAVGYSTAANVLGAATFILIGRNAGFTDAESATLVAALGIIYNAFAVIVKKLLDRYIVESNSSVVVKA